MVRFTQPVRYAEMNEWIRWSEVQKMEPILEVPVKIKVGDRSEEELLTGVEVTSQLRKVYDMYGQQHPVPEEGILLNEAIANRLGLRPGDMVEVQTAMGIGPSRTEQLRIVGTNQPILQGFHHIDLFYFTKG
jgi:putative ABC transport system permease protein